MRPHRVGIQVVVYGSHLQSGVWRAVCDDCDWAGPEYGTPKEAQPDAIAHQGGVLHVRERRIRKDPILTDPETAPEMFPGVA